jgi:hypothetical protein
MRKTVRFSFFYIVMAVTAVFMFISEGATQGPDAGLLIKKDSAGFPPGIEKARDSVMDFFKPVSGVVAGIESGIVKVSFDDKEDVKKGMRLSVFRKGKVFYHPVTKEPVGKTEDLAGRIEVREVDVPEGFHLCRVISGDIKAGDIVRITSSKIKLAFFQERNSDWGLSEDFYESLKDSGRFEILESYTASFKPADLAVAARGLDAEVFLVFSTPVKNRNRALNVKLYWTGDAGMFGDIEGHADPGSGTALSGNEFMSADTIGPGPQADFKIAKAGLMAIGDVDGSGSLGIVVSDGRNIRIYNLKKDELHELWHIRGRTGEKHLSLDILDLNNNGISEIFVTSLATGNNVSSFVIEYDPSGYRKIKEGIPYFLRVSGKKLLMQRFNSLKFVSGPVYEGEWKDGDYRTGMPFNLPAGVNIYGFAYIDWRNDGRKHLMTYDDQGHLSLYDESGQLVWKSAETYWISDLTIKRNTYSTVSFNMEWPLRGRLLSIQTERGQELIVLKKIHNISIMPGLGSRGVEVYSLWWNGVSMDEKLMMNEIPGSVMDYRLKGNSLFVLVKSGVASIVKNAAGGEFSKVSVLQYYNLGTK